MFNHQNPQLLITNQKGRTPQIKINNQIITDIKGPKDMFRLLGVYITNDT
jgi:hypothetical protein